MVVGENSTCREEGVSQLKFKGEEESELLDGVAGEQGLESNKGRVIKDVFCGWVSECGPRMESPEEKSQCLWENFKKTRQEYCDPSFFRNTELFLECAFVFLPGIVDRREFASDYSLQLAIVICLYASMGKHVFATRGLSLWLYTLLMWPLRV